MLAISSVSIAQSIEGDWFGKISIDGIELRLSLHVKAADQGFTSTWDSPDQNAMGIPSTTTIFKFPEFSFPTQVQVSNTLER